jgi:hypothetical protein
MKTELIRSESYIETMTVFPVNALDGDFEVKVISQLLHAKNPDQLHTRFQTMMSFEELARLNNDLTQYLQSVELEMNHA